MFVRISINNEKVQIKQNTTVLQACNELQINVPKFCFHETLQIAGNCRMCLVEIKNSPKPVVSCSMPVLDGMEVFTDTPLVKKAREMVLEFLLINHPLDCPICDQGGECDLQEQALTFGSDRSRFFFNKRAIENKNCGSFIKTIMTRCIHCTRCVRFAQEIGGVDKLGTTGRGNKTEISFYLSRIFQSEFSANVIDLCPVGALTSKPYSFVARPWELKSFTTINLFDSFGPLIRVQTYNNKIIRVLPCKSPQTGVEFISNKTRFFYDSLDSQRITKPLVKINGSFKPLEWSEAFTLIDYHSNKLDCSEKGAITGDYIGLKELDAFKNVVSKLGINKIRSAAAVKAKSDFREQFIFDDLGNKLPKSNLCLLINCDPRLDSSTLTLKLNSGTLKNNLEIYSIGPILKLPYQVKNIGLTSVQLSKILSGNHQFSRKITEASNFTIFLGGNPSLNCPILKLLGTYFKGQFSILPSNTGFWNFSEIVGQNPFKKKIVHNKLLVLFNTHNLFRIALPAFTVYVGHHFNSDAEQADLVLPNSAFLEQQSTHLNCYGSINETTAVRSVGAGAKRDYELLNYWYKFVVKLNLSTNLSYDRVHFNELFIYLQKKKSKKEVKTTAELSQVQNIKIIDINLNILKLSTDNLFPRNSYETSSKILMNSILHLQKIGNFIT